MATQQQTFILTMEYRLSSLSQENIRLLLSAYSGCYTKLY